MTRTSDTVSVLGFAWKHPANRGKRIWAVSRAIQFQLSGRLLYRRTIARLGEHSSLWVDLHRTGASKVVYGNPPDYPEMLIWQQVLQSGDLFVDVGTNVGSYTIWAADLGAEVIALEPAVAERKIVDGRNTLAPEVWREAGWDYRALGRPVLKAAFAA